MAWTTGQAAAIYNDLHEMEEEMQVVCGHASFAPSLRVQTVPAGSAVVSVNAAFNGKMKSHKNVVQKLKGYPAIQSISM